MKNIKNVQKMLFDSSKEASWCTECNAKTPRFLQGTVSKKIKKTLQKWPFFAVLVKNVYFMRVFLIFSETVLCTDPGFFGLHSVHQDASFDLSKTYFGHFFIFFIIRGDPFDFRLGKNLPAPEVMDTNL